VTQIIDGGWWEGTLHGITGWFPSNYVREMKVQAIGVYTVSFKNLAIARMATVPMQSYSVAILFSDNNKLLHMITLS